MVNQVNKSAIQLCVLVIVVCCGYFGARLLGGLFQGYRWADMDWGRKGYTTFADVMTANDIGVHTIDVNGKTCREFFYYKDARPIKTICDSNIK
jgi:hypothetical protein